MNTIELKTSRFFFLCKQYHFVFNLYNFIVQFLYFFKLAFIFQGSTQFYLRYAVLPGLFSSIKCSFEIFLLRQRDRYRIKFSSQVYSYYQETLVKFSGIYFETKDQSFDFALKVCILRSIFVRAGIETTYLHYLLKQLFNPTNVKMKILDI